MNRSGHRVMQSDSHAAAGIRAGDVLAGKYRVERVLGVGGMGVVVAAHHLQLDERVALKFLLPEALGNPEAVARFAREARAAVKIKSEHVARIIDVGTLPNGAPYMVMEYLDGGDLAAWIQERGALPIEQAVEFVLQACVAVADAHALGIVHRDLKPANLFCIRRSDGQLSIKVLDFGISKMADASGSGWGSMTRTSAAMGSPLYMSPEQMRSSRDVDSQTDIWALGMILFELMTGRPAFLADTVTELAIKVATEPIPAIGTFRPDVPSGLEAIVFKCAEKERRRRYHDVAQLAVALLPFAPKRARASVERISGIIQSAGLSLSSLAVPPSPQDAGTQMSARSSPAVGRTTLGSSGRRTAAVGGVGVAAVVVAVVTLLMLKRGAAQHVAPTLAVVPSGVAATAQQGAPVDPPKIGETQGAAAVPTETPPAVSSTAPVPVVSLPQPVQVTTTTRSKKAPPTGTAPSTPSPTRSAPKAAAAIPCKLIKTMDNTGEVHFSCPCASCE